VIIRNQFIITIVLQVSGIVLDYRQSLYTDYAQNLDQLSKEYRTIVSDVHLRSAQRLLELCKANGGAFIKVGQHLGALDYLIPNEYVSTLRVLHSQAPQSEFKEILSVIRQDLQCEPSEVFSHIEEKPIGSASIAQVHRAQLKDGTTVAVKVQHPQVKMYSQADIKAMEVSSLKLLDHFNCFSFKLNLETQRYRY